MIPPTGQTNAVATVATQRTSVAIVGMACTFPGARNLLQFWQNIVSGVDAVSDAPPLRWDPALYYDPNIAGKIYCKRGGYIGTSFTFDPLKCGTMPRAIDGAEPEQFLVLRAVYEALQDAGCLHNERLPRERTAVVLGRGNYLGAGVTGLVQRGMITEQTLEVLRRLHPEFSPAELEAVRRELQAQLPPFGPDSAPGLIPNIVSGRVANRLNLMGPTFTIDAACASSLIAAEIGIRGLQSGQFDAVLAGGVHLFADVSFLHVFSAMGALSRSSVVRPFDRDCDGTISGEGVGILVLKRLADAERDGDRIYAVIRGIGTSSDGKALSVTAPRIEGEILALRRAYEMAGVSPDTVGLIEAHGTGTPVGDETELLALHSVFGPRRFDQPSVALGSIKSMIGHAMPAAGAAALIKTALSIYHGLLPPTLNCRSPHRLLKNGESRFYVNSRTQPWIHGDAGHPRRAGVNAFGFGGVNAHVVLEEYRPIDAASLHSTNGTAGGARAGTLIQQWDAELVVIEAPGRDALIARLRLVRQYALQATGVPLRDIAFSMNCEPRTEVGGSSADDHRIAFVATSLTDLVEKLDYAIARLSDATCKQIKDTKGVYYLHESPARNGKLAFLFPGLGAQYTNLMADLCVHFPEFQQCFERANRAMASASDDPLSSYLFPPPPFTQQEADAAELRLARIERANPAVMTANGAMFLLLDRLGVRADMMTGHSSGEWVVMPASGMVTIDEFVASMSKLGGVWRQLGENASVPTMTMLAVGADRETVAKLAAEIDRPIHVANDNCMHQVVVVAAPETAELVAGKLRARGVFVDRLPYEHGYHTHEFTYVTQALRSYFSAMGIHPPRARLYSCTTAKPYPDATQDVVDLLAHTFARPLLFRDTIEAMYADGARVFVEVGPRGNLTAFVDDILRGRPHAAIATNHHGKSGISVLMHALAQLAALHVPLNLSPLYERRAAQMLSFDPERDRPIDESRRPGAVQISLCCPKLELAPRSPRPIVAGDVTYESARPEPVTAGLGIAPSSHAEEPVDSRRPTPTVQPDAPPPRASNGESASLVMQQHLRLMENFLQVNQDVMQAYLAGRLAPSTAANAQPFTPDPQEHQPPPETRPAPAAPVMPVEDPFAEVRKSAARIADAAPAAETTPPDPRQPEASSPAPVQAIQDRLLAIVSERTGYPPDMLDLDLDMEADLGIDSIKRVEILGALQQAGDAQSDAAAIDMEAVAKLKTLRQIVNFLAGAASGSAETVRPAQSPGDQSRRVEDSIQPRLAGGSADVLPPMTFSARIKEHTPGSSVVVLREIRVEEDLYLHDHCFDPYISDADPDRERLGIVPLTVSLEMMAETASILEPSRRLVSARNIQAAKWIEVEPGGPRVEIEITAHRLSSDEIQVSVRAAGGNPAEPSAAPLAEGTFVFAASFPPAPQPTDDRLRNARAPANTASQMYEERRMFHGPRFHGVASIDSVAEDGLLATLQVLPASDVLRGQSAPRFVFDPFLLDAAGQLVGYWPVEYLQEGFVLFPIRIQDLTLYRENLAAGQRACCRLRIADVSKRQLRADIDVLAPDGSLWMRITGWEDWRFYWQPDFYDFWRYPNKGIVSKPLDLAIPGGTGVECRRMEPFGEMGSSMWENLWAHLILSRRELHEYRSMGAGPRRTQWIFGRAAAKDAIRVWIARHHGLSLYPADIEIAPDEHGKPWASGFWAERVGEIPQLSLSHKGGVAVAAAGRFPIGIDLETITERDAGFEGLAFSEQERGMIGQLNDGADRNEWLTRAWCAKEAAGKAAGNGLRLNPKRLVLRSIDPHDGRIVVSCAVDGESSPPVNQDYEVHSRREGDFVVALALVERTHGATVGP